jgi:hypothetical protein
MVGHAWHELDEMCLKGLLADSDGPFCNHGAILLKKGRSATVAEVSVMVRGQPRQAILKRFNVTGWRDPLASVARMQPAIRSWVQGHGFRERGLPTARPLAVWHRRRFGLLWEGYLLTEKVEQARELNQVVNDLAGLPVKPRQTQIRALIAETAALIRELHLRLYSHRDLKAANILVVREPGRQHEPLPESFSTLAGFVRLINPRLVFIDLVGVEGPGRLGFARKAQNLARLHVSFCQCPLLTRSDKLRFLRAYMQWNLKGKTGWKRWWQAIAKATRAKIDRNRKTGRVLG